MPASLACHVPRDVAPVQLPHGASLSLVSSPPQVRAKMSVVIVSGVKVTEAVLLFSADSLLLCEGFTLSPAGDVCCRKHQPSRCCCHTAESGSSSRVGGKCSP